MGQLRRRRMPKSVIQTCVKLVITDIRLHHGKKATDLIITGIGLSEVGRAMHKWEKIFRCPFNICLNHEGIKQYLDWIDEVFQVEFPKWHIKLVGEEPK
jgi:hypothetical protein